MICEQTAHVYLWEVGGIAFHSGASVALLPGDRGRLTAAQVEAAIRPEQRALPHHPPRVPRKHPQPGWRQLLRAGQTWRPSAALAKAHGLARHLDGARIFNALVATGQRSEDYGQLFDSISVCLCKGLGAPVGSVLLGSAEFIQQVQAHP